MKQFITFLMLAFTIVAHSQNVTIDYQTWNPSNPPCKLFVNATNVPASGTTLGTIEHQTLFGQPFYNTTDLSVQMQTIFQTTGAVKKGATYRIAYNFKSGYSYMIYVTAAAVENTIGYTTGPYFRLDVNNYGGGGGIVCNGADNLTVSASGNPAPIKLNSDVFQEFQLVFPALGTQPTLTLTAFPADNGGTKTVRIRKVRIVETAPAATFTITPSAVSIPCGTSTAATFTVNNVNNSPGTLAYNWNLGSATNGWLYNGSPAPQTFTTSTNSINLTSSATTNSLGNVSVITTLNGAAQPTLTSVANYVLPSYSIVGANTICNTSASPYKILSTPTGTSIVWSATPIGIATINTPNALQTTITKIQEGSITLSAAVSSPGCGTVTANKPVRIGQYLASDFPISGPDEVCKNSGTSFGAPSLLGATDYIWAVPSDWSIASGQGTSYLTVVTGSTFGVMMPVRLRVLNACTTTGSNTVKSVLVKSCGSNLFAVSPNPASNLININRASGSKVSKNIMSAFRIIEITNKMGVVIKRIKFQNGTQSSSIDISDLRADNYFLRIFNGKDWEQHSIIINR